MQWPVAQVRPHQQHVFDVRVPNAGRRLHRSSNLSLTLPLLFVMVHRQGGTLPAVLMLLLLPRDVCHRWSRSSCLAGTRGTWAMATPVIH
jgi:hypothetical protein